MWLPLLLRSEVNFVSSWRWFIFHPYIQQYAYSCVARIRDCAVHWACSRRHLTRLIHAAGADCTDGGTWATRTRFSSKVWNRRPSHRMRDHARLARRPFPKGKCGCHPMRRISEEASSFPFPPREKVVKKRSFSFPKGLAPFPPENSALLLDVCSHRKLQPY